MPGKNLKNANTQFCPNKKQKTGSVLPRRCCIFDSFKINCMSWHADDLIMTRLVESIVAPVASTRDDLYLALIESVISQQLSVKVADVIYNRFASCLKTTTLPPTK